MLADDSDLHKISIKEGFDEDAVVNAFYEVSENETKLVLNASDEYQDKEQAYIAGYAEGFLMAQQLSDFKSNVLLDLGFSQEWPKFLQ